MLDKFVQWLSGLIFSDRFFQNSLQKIYFFFFAVIILPILFISTFWIWKFNQNMPEFWFVFFYYLTFLFTFLLIWVMLAIIKNLRQFKFINDFSNDPKFLLDETGKFIYVNKMASRNLGFEEKEFLNMNISQIDLHYDAARFKKFFDNRGPTPYWETKYKR